MDLVEKKLLANDWTTAAKFIALIAQAEVGDYDPLRPPHPIYSQYQNISAHDTDAKPQEFLHRVVQEHRECRVCPHISDNLQIYLLTNCIFLIQGMKPSSAEYWLLKHISNLENFGEELFHKNPGLGVGPHGICVYPNEGEKQT